MDDRWNRVPDGIDPIVGYRAWYYTIGQRGARLHPLIQRGSGVHAGVSDWDGASWGWVTATCSRGAASWHVAPEENCTCGLRHEHTAPVVSACGFRTAEIGTGDTSGVVLGRVEFAGKVVEHEWGYRAERARIVELIPLRGTERSVMILAARLGVSIAEPVDMPSMQEELGGLPGQPQGSSPRFRDYLWEHRWMTATLLVGFVVVALSPAGITTVTLFAILFANKLDQGVVLGQAPKPSPKPASATPPPPWPPRGSSPPAA